jgi:hypothetical protein
MKTIFLCIFIFVNVTISCFATNTEYEEKVSTTFLIVTDWATTRNMSKRYNEGYRETGYVMTKLYGSHPSTQEVDTYFVGRLLLHYFISNTKALSYGQRKIYYTLTFFDHGSAVVNNLSIGLKLKF